MSIRVVFLGTSGSVPTLKRSLPAVIVQCSREQLMFDCGENVQRQMMQAKTSFHKKMRILDGYYEKMCSLHLAAFP